MLLHCIMFYSRTQVFIGSLLLRHLNVLQFNAHEIYEFIRVDPANIKPNKNSLVGLGVYPQVLN